VYHDGHTDSYSVEQSGELASPEKTQAISDLSNPYRDLHTFSLIKKVVKRNFKNTTVRVAFNPHSPSFLSTDEYTQLKVVTHRLPRQCEVAKTCWMQIWPIDHQLPQMLTVSCPLFQQHFKIVPGVSHINKYD
jgi:hypothetical protein